MHPPTNSPLHDVFISHASEDKMEVARPLAALLIQHGLKVWFDEHELTVGDSLRRAIETGLRSSRFGIVILSKSFFEKEWPQKELDALVSREDGSEKVILPVLHNLSKREVVTYSPILADKLSANTLDGIPQVANTILAAIAKAKMQSAGNSLGDSSNEVITASATAKGRGPKRIDALMMAYIDKVVEYAENETEIAGIRTGLYDLDRILSGLQPGELYVVSGRPSVGNTSFCITVAQNVAIHEELPVVLFAPGTSSVEVVQRLTAAIGRIDRYGLNSGRLNDDEWQRLVTTAETVAKCQLYVDDQIPISSSEILDRSKLIHDDYGALGLIIVDGIELLSDVHVKEEADFAIRELRHLARQLACPILVSTSLNRSADMRIDKRPLLSDLSHADAFELHATAIMFLYRDDYYNRDSRIPGAIEVIVAKNRNGISGTVLFTFDRRSGRIDNPAVIMKPEVVGRQNDA